MTSLVIRSSSPYILIAILLAGVGTSRVQGEDQVSFDRDIRPLLSARCFACHGPDGHAREAGLRLDQSDGDEGAIGLAIEPGSVDDSEMWNRITTDDESILMPPPQSHLKPFNEKEQTLIRRWIEAGAPYEDFWAFVPPKEPKIPEIADNQWSDLPIDVFVLNKLNSLGLKPAKEASPRTLIRRVTFDLTGLPPTVEEIHEFLAAHETDPLQAWEELVDRLIARPQYGEHMARYWLDLVRFADTNGMHKDFYRNHVAYRDWVIRAFNDNLPYDEFTKFQLAGDLYPQPTRDQLIASGFNRLHLIIDRGTALPEESHMKNVIDRLTAVSTAFMGLTVQCSQCHDHKFDPITQKDFYSLYAFFNNIDSEPETVARPPQGLQPPFISLGTPEQEQQLQARDDEIAKLKRRLHEATEEQKPALEKQMKALQKQRSEFDQNIPKAMVMRERSEPRATFVLERGQYDAPGEPVMRATPAFLPPLKTSGELPSRMDLANWTVAAENPLTARVTVNRFWQPFFGVGLVKTSEDFGNQGEVPSHPELLEHLTVSFIESGWDVKSLIKQIVMSKTYRQASEATPEQFQQDPENRRLARGSRFRLDAEMIRDSILLTSGMLSDRMFGPSVKPPQPDGLWKSVTMTGDVFRPDSGEAAVRRSVYTYWKRAMPPPQMTILNAPIRDACIARRERTNTPSQALLLLNEPEYLRAAKTLASETLKRPEGERVNFAWETITAGLPDTDEKQELSKLLADLKSLYDGQPELAKTLCGEAGVELAAWTMICNTLYNLDVTKTRQ